MIVDHEIVPENAGEEKLHGDAQHNHQWTFVTDPEPLYLPTPVYCFILNICNSWVILAVEGGNLLLIYYRCLTPDLTRAGIDIQELCCH